MVAVVVGGIQRRDERKRALGRIPLGFVGDVVEDQAVEAERAETSDGNVSDLLCPFAIRREAGWGESEEQDLPLAGLDTADQIHGRDGIGAGGGCDANRRDTRGTATETRG